MPSLRVLRDRGGIEHVFVVHPFRQQGRVRHRVLYWFRTVSHVRGGRVMLDEATRRDIEAAFPSLTFNWPEMLRSIETMSWAESAAPRPRQRPSSRAEPAPAEPPGTASEVEDALASAAADGPVSRVSDGAADATSHAERGATSHAERPRRRRRSRRGRRGLASGDASNRAESGDAGSSGTEGRGGANEDERPASL